MPVPASDWRSFNAGCATNVTDFGEHHVAACKPAQAARFSDYVGYSHVKTKDDGVGAVDEGDEFVTYVLRLKERIGRKWITA